MKNVTGKEPIWMQACDEYCKKSCVEHNNDAEACNEKCEKVCADAKHYNVAEIRYEDTNLGKVLGSGQFGTVFKGVVRLQNNIR